MTDPHQEESLGPPESSDRSQHDMAAVLDLMPLALVDSSVDLDSHLQILAERIRATLSADVVLVLLQQPDGESLLLRAEAHSELSKARGLEDRYRRIWLLNSGVVGWVMNTGQSAFVDDITQDPRARVRPRSGAESVIAAPLLVEGRAIGVVRVAAFGAGRFVESDQRLVDALALATGIVVENARLSKEARDHTDEIESRVQALTTLQEIGTVVLETMDSLAVVDLVLEKALSLGPFDLGVIHLVRDNQVEPVATRGFWNLEHAESYTRSTETGRRQSMFHVLSSQEPLVISDVPSYDGLRALKPEGVKSAVVVPIHAGAEVLGIFAVGTRTHRDVAPRMVQLLTAMGSQLGVAIQKARFYEEIQKALEDLRRTEEGHARLAAILEATPDLVAIADSTGRRMYLNAAGRRILGIDPDADITADAFTDDRPPWAREQLLNEAIPAATRDGIWTGESVFVSRDGREVPVSQVILAHRGADGAVELFSTIARDLTLRRRLESQLTRAQGLETAGRIAGQVAHDFNNLLAPLVGYPELIKMRLPPDHPIVGFCDEMLASATRMAEINDDLLTLGRRGHFVHAPVDLNQLVGDALVETTERPGGLTVRLELAPDLLPVLGSSAQLTRLLANLIANARDAMRDVGTLEIRTQSVYLDQPIGRYTQINVGEYVQIDVSDTGSGISPETREKMFDVFFTTKTTDKRRGSGLGLSVVLAVVDDHQAYVDFDSVIGSGTTFRVYFPVHRGPVAVEPRSELRGGNESILVVDDDAGQRDVVSMMLGALGYQVELVESGELAISKIKEQSFDLVILDMVMPPGIDGAETYRQIVEIRPGQRAIIVSGFSESGRVGEAQALGAGAYVRKPVTLERLAHAVRQELARTS